MFLSIFRISASNVLKTILNIIVSIRCVRTFVTNQPKRQEYALLISRYLSRQESNIKVIKTKLYTHNTTGDWPRNKFLT